MCLPSSQIKKTILQNRNSFELVLRFRNEILSGFGFLLQNDLERRCAAITESKEHYKQQWQMALKEIAKMRDRVDSEHERRLNEKDREITNLRMELERAREPWNKGSVRSLSTKDRYHRENEKSSENSPRRQR